MKKITALFFSLLFIATSTSLIAQKGSGKGGSITIKGGTYYFEEKTNKKVAVPETNIAVYKGTEKVKEVQSNKKGLYEFTLDYGDDYTIALENNPDYIYECYFVEASTVPGGKQNIKTTIEIDGVLIPDNRKGIDPLKYKFPFTKLKFDGNKKFTDDPKYLLEFTKGTLKEYKTEKSRIKKEEASKVDNAKKEANTRYRKISGKLFSGTPATKPEKGIKINLVDEGGKVVESSTTNKLGRFGFNKIDVTKNYTLQTEGSDTSAIINSSFSILNKLGNEVATVKTNEKGVFNYKLLSTDQKTFKLIQVEDNTLSMAGSFYGQLKENDTEAPLKNTVVVLINANGQLIDRATTNEAGGFVFTKLPPDQNIMIRIEELDPAFKGLSKAILKNQNGKVIAKIDNDGLNSFQFKFLAPEQINFTIIDTEDTKIISGAFTGTMKDGKSKPLANNKVILLNNKGVEVASGSTNDNGEFSFENLPSDQNYFVKIAELDPAYKSLTKLTLKDGNGKLISSANNDGTSEFQFTYLSQHQNSIDDLIVDETTLRMTLKGRMLTGNEANSIPFVNMKVDLFNTEGTLIKSTQTDDKGNFALKGMKVQLGYYLVLDTTNSQLTTAKNLLMADSRGKVYKEMDIIKGSEFKFHLLISDEMNLANFYAK